MMGAGVESGAVTLKIVYYGPPGAGKTTNLERVSTLIYGNGAGRVTPTRVGENRVASVEIDLGPIGVRLGPRVIVRLLTMQGEVASAGRAWTGALAEADGIVFVADSSPHARIANVRALAGMRERLENRSRTVASIPVVMQWNKRDEDDARPVAALEMELNHRCFPSIESSSRRGTGVAETMIEILRRTINAAHQRAGGSALPEAELTRTLTAAIERHSQSAHEDSIERFGMTIERYPAAHPDVREAQSPAWSSDGNRPREVIYSAEVFGREPAPSGMLAALERATSSLGDERSGDLPRGLMAGLLDGCERSRGSLLLFQPGTQRLDDWDVVPAGNDPLNARPATAGGTTAAALCSAGTPVLIDHPVPGGEHLRAAWVVPLIFGSVNYGGIIVYVTREENLPGTEEKAYWRTFAGLTSVFLAWRIAGATPVGALQKGASPSLDQIERLDG